MIPTTISTSDGQQFATGSALYDVPLKPCCREVFLDDECDCAEVAAQVESAPLIVIGGAS